MSRSSRSPGGVETPIGTGGIAMLKEERMTDGDLEYGMEGDWESAGFIHYLSREDLHLSRPE
jgi:hypothetical protein